MIKAQKNKLDRRISVAPMMNWTDRHDRYFLRLISSNVLLYTEMMTTGALVYGKKPEFLEYNKEENPLALQLGGSDPKELAYCVKLAKKYNYDEINLNCGCPSDRVQKGKIGACLMEEPRLVAECIDAMKQVTDTPISIKTRIGIDDKESYGFLTDFIGASAEKGCDIFIIHARKALLQGLSPSQNREIPPLKWERAYKLKKDFPKLKIILNGGIKTLEDINQALDKLDGVMIGREAYKNPYFLASIEKEIFKNNNILSRDEVIEKLILYIDKSLEGRTRLKDISRHILGLYQGMRGAKKYRQILSQEAYKENSDSNLIREALKYVQSSI